MVSQGLAALRKKGVASAVLFVEQSNAIAKKLYESIGFWVGREDILVRFTRAS
jgi:ribosomal protein S18 acetylase RimI-like enzyme